MNEENNNVYIDLKKQPLKSEREEIRRKRIGIIIQIALCLLLFVGGIGIGYLIPRKPSTNTHRFQSVLEQVEYILQSRYLYSDKSDDFAVELEDKALTGMTTFPDDPFTSYMSQKQLEAFYTGINQSFVGVGIQYTKVNDAGMITKVFFDSPAERAGLQEGDLFTHIDGISVADKTTDEIKDLAIGEEGTEVRMTVLRDGQEMEITVIRGTVDYTVVCDRYDDYLYMSVESFGESTAKEMSNYFDRNEDVKKIILDLRGNGGGFQSAASQVCGLFIGDNQVYLQQQDNAGNRFASTTKTDKTYKFDKIVILANKTTASAAEVFTICLKERCENVTVVGTPTYGKGVIQNTLMLNNGGSLKFTDYYWYSPDGVSIHKTGITPDITVENDEVWTVPYVDMDDETTFAREDVSDVVELCEKCLRFIEYPVDHTNGYFDETLEETVNDIRRQCGMEENGLINKEVYEIILSNTIYVISNDPGKDYQLNKARELMHEDNN